MDKRKFLRPDVEAASARADMLAIMTVALAAVDPNQAIRAVFHRDGDTLTVGDQTYDLSVIERVLVVGGGKAGASMAQAIEAVLGDRIAAGWVNVKYEHSVPTRYITLHEAGHPVPDAAGMAGTQALLDILADTTPHDLVICLISGGGSALLTLPVEGVSLADMQQLTGALLRSGAPIQDMNTVRKHLSRVKGGQLARAAHPASLVTLILSDVVGSPLDVIASGPTVPDSSLFADAQQVLQRFGLAESAPESIRAHLRAGAMGQVAETPKPGDPSLAAVQNVIVADNARAAQAAAEHARQLGYHTLLLTTFLEGEARVVAQMAAALAKEILASGQPVPRPACVLLGGETTVTIRGDGRGGRNQELALAVAVALDGVDGAYVISLATDGTDGPTDAAGGMVDGGTVARGAAQGLDARAFLDNNDAYPYLDKVGDLLVTGPTHTNVNDLIAVVVP